jgi:hypothetical protein
LLKFFKKNFVPIANNKKEKFAPNKFKGEKITVELITGNNNIGIKKLEFINIIFSKLFL